MALLIVAGIIGNTLGYASGTALNTMDEVDLAVMVDATSAEASDGTLVTPNGSGTTEGTVKLDYVSNKWKYVTTITSSEDSSRSCQFKDVTCDESIGEAAQLLCAALEWMDSQETGWF